jgi:hypothetical protein
MGSIAREAQAALWSKAHPALLVYDFDKNHHGFAFKLRVE